VLRRLTFTLVALLAGGALSARAADPDPEFRRVAETEHARYFAPKGLKVDVGRSETFLVRLFGLFGVAPSERRVDYYRHASIEELKRRIGISAYGVTDLDALRIDSVRDFHPHELVHAVAGRLGRPPLLFTEGLAVALSSEGRWRGKGIDEIARAYVRTNRGIDPLVSDFGSEDPDRDYAVAASFVAFLLDRDGIDAMIAFLRGCGTAPESYETAFRSAYGRGVLVLGVEWEQQLLAGSAPRRAWYDSRDWPRTLRQARAVPQLADAGPVPAGGVARAPGPALLSVGP
jgi:hypothetical protein